MMAIYITNPSKKHACDIARALLQKRLIACANIFPVESLYWWKGKMVEGKEWVAIFKTEDKKYARIQKEVRATHPYTVPCILKLSVEANKEYVEWVKESIEVRGA